jgi:hypothetical protein
MPNLKKPVQFDHFKPHYSYTDKNGVLHDKEYDLHKLLKAVASVPFSETKKKVAGDMHMFHICKYDEGLGVWEIQLLHLREKILPGIADDDGAFELIKLEDNQYPAESTTLLYDTKRKTLYMQRNIYGTSIRALEQYIQLLMPDGYHVLLEPILSGSRIDKISVTNSYRKVILVADREQLTEEDNKMSLANILRSFGNFNGRIVKIELGFGKQKRGRLDPVETTKLIKEAYAYPGTSGLKVRTAEDEDTAFETINLLDDRDKFLLSVEYSRNNPITHERLYRMCLGEYKEKWGIK